MNAPIPSGTEMMLKTILKFLGIKPEHIVEPLTQIRDITLDADARLKRLEAQNLAILKHLGIDQNGGPC